MRDDGVVFLPVQIEVNAAFADAEIASPFGILGEERGDLFVQPRGVEPRRFSLRRIAPTVLPKFIE